MFSARVRNGVIVADGVALTEGATVTVVDDADLDDGEHELTGEQQEAVERGRAELARGEGVSRAELMATLRSDRDARAADALAAPGGRPSDSR